MARIDDYIESFRLASEDLRQSDLVEIAESAGAQFKKLEDGTSALRLLFFGTPILIWVGDRVEVMREDSEKDMSLPERILIVHYLLGASGICPTGKMISYRQIPDGMFYFEAFQRRARDPFLATFGNNADLFRTCATTVGGRPVPVGDVGMEFDLLPHVTVQLVLWQGDEDFPSEASVLFDESIQTRLSAEDIAVLSGMLVYRLVGLACKLYPELKCKS
ncbi:MAG TPA: DUF3786 domain-containing protein [Syntrophobacter fumaroxidans]|nr:DUF3786 domain-containing protein [Syntrophobacter fumaroxidans]